MAFASQQTVEILASEEELKTLETAFDGDERNKLSRAWGSVVKIESDEDRHIMLKQMLIDARKAVFDVPIGCLVKCRWRWRRSKRATCSIRSSNVSTSTSSRWVRTIWRIGVRIWTGSSSTEPQWEIEGRSDRIGLDYGAVRALSDPLRLLRRVLGEVHQLGGRAESGGSS